VFELLAKGHTAAYISDALRITLSTSKTHITHIYQKLGIHSQQEMLVWLYGEIGEAYREVGEVYSRDETIGERHFAS